MARLTPLMRLTHTMVDRTLASVHRVSESTSVTEAIKFNLSNLIVPGLTYKVPAHGQFLFLERRQFPKRSFGDLGGLPPCLELGGLRVANAPAVLCTAPRAIDCGALTRLPLSPRPARFDSAFPSSARIWLSALTSEEPWAVTGEWNNSIQIAVFNVKRLRR